MSQSANKDPEAPVSINIVRDIFIEASIQVAFQATLDELGPDG